jgi:hypothetical protein
MDATKVVPPEGYDGIEVTLGKFVYVAPALSLKAMRTMLPKIASLSDPATSKEASFDILSELVLTALKRNYPDLTQDVVEDGLDIKNMNDVMTAILAASGLERGKVPAAPDPANP